MQRAREYSGIMVRYLFMFNSNVLLIYEHLSKELTTVFCILCFVYEQECLLLTTLLF